MYRRFFAILLCLVLICSLLPAGALAAGDEDHTLVLYYDTWKGAAFTSVGTEPPEANAAYFQMEGWGSERSFSLSASQANDRIWVLLDPTQRIRRDIWDEQGEIVLEPGEDQNNPDRAVSVIASYWDPITDSWFHGPVVVCGEAVKDGFTFENNLLSFRIDADVELDVFWYESIYDVVSFEATEECPVIIEYKWWGDGWVDVPDWIDPADQIVRDGIARVRVPLNTEELTFTWEGGHLNRISWLDEENNWLEAYDPAGGSFTLPLDQTLWDGRKNDFYQIEFSFSGGNWDYQLSMNYDVHRGSVFWALGEEAPLPDAAHYLLQRDWGEENWISFLEGDEITQVHLLIDPTKALDESRWWEDGTICFTDPWDEKEISVYVQARFETVEGYWLDEPVVYGDMAVMDGFTYENGILSFTPPSGCNMELDLYWDQESYEFYRFGSTEECPVVVEYDWRGEGGIPIPEEANGCEWIQLDDRMRLRLPDTVQQLTFYWEGHMGRISGDFLSEDGQWGDLWLPEMPFVYPLDRQEDDGRLCSFYRLEFEFDSEEWDFLCRTYYDANGGAVFGAVGGADPEVREADYLADAGIEIGLNRELSFRDADDAPQQICLLLRPDLALDMEAMEEGRFALRESWSAPDRSISIRADYRQPNGEWFSGPIVENGVSVQEGFEFSDNVLRFTPACGFSIHLTVFWTETDYLFASFEGTDEKPVLVNVEWYGDGTPILLDSVPAEDMLVAGNRMVLRVPLSTEILNFSWTEDSLLSSISVEGAGEDGGWLNGIIPAGQVFTLELNQTWNDEPCTWYHVNFLFDSSWIGDEGDLRMNYDPTLGCVFASLGDRIPSADAEDFLSPDWDSPLHFLNDSNEPQTIRLLIDETKALELSSWYNQGVVAFTEPVQMPDKAVYLTAVFRTATGAFRGTVLENGVLTEAAAAYGFTWENSLLSFTPNTVTNVELRLFWSEEHYRFDSLQPTEERPICVELGWSGPGTIHLPEEADPEFTAFFADRVRFLLPEGTEEVTFSWDAADSLRAIWVEGLGEDGSWLEIPFPDGLSYTLLLNRTWEDGSPVIWYNLQFDFEEQTDYKLFLDYRRSEGSVFGGLNIPAAVLDGSAYIDQSFSFNCGTNQDPEIGTVCLTLDPTRAPAYFSGEEIQFVELGEHEIRPWILLDCDLPDGSHFSGFVVEDGAAVQDGVTFADNVLSFTPAGPAPIWLQLFWDEADKDYSFFGPTDEAPVLVEVMEARRCPLIRPDVPAEDMAFYHGVEHEYVKYRVSEELDELVFGWENPGDIAFIDGEGIFDGEDYGGINELSGTSYALNLHNRDSMGNRRYYFFLSFWPRGLDYSALQEAYDTATSVDRSLYTAASLAALDEALAAAEAWGEGPEPTEQEEIDAITQLLLDAIAGLVEKPVFTDVKPGAFYAKAVAWAVEDGITTGTTPTTFSPNKTCTRGQVVTFLWRAAGSPEPSQTSHSFTDVKPSAYYYTAMLWAVENGITTGTSATTFGPNKDCTRVQVVTFLWRFFGSPQPSLSENPFTDVKAGNLPAVLWAVEKDVTKGTTETTFSPNKTCTRGQVVTFLYRAFVPEP